MDARYDNGYSLHFSNIALILWCSYVFVGASYLGTVDSYSGVLSKVKTTCKWLVTRLEQASEHES
jgi:hypothetical protein